MIQCHDCEFFHRSATGEFTFTCDPFSTIKEPECLAKWQLIKINQMVASYHATLNYYRKLAPMQEKMFKVMERELDGMDETERWKASTDDEEDVADDAASGNRDDSTGPDDSRKGDWDTGPQKFR